MNVPSQSRQLAFHQLLVAARKTWLKDALSVVLEGIDQRTLKRELSELVPEDVQRILAAGGIRDEFVFPAPVVLRAQPRLLGYYRLLLGVSQKTFYGTEAGLSKFKSMELSGALTSAQDAEIELLRTRTEMVLRRGSALAECEPRTVSVWRRSCLGLLSGWCRCSLLVTRAKDDPACGCLSSDLSGQRDRCRPGARLLA